MLGKLYTPCKISSSGNTASTAVWLQADTDKLIVAAPTQINMIVQADGTMTGPSAAATQIKNGSAFGIHVSKIQTTAKNSFALESTAKANDSASVTITPGAGTAVNLADTLSGMAITSGTDWNMAKVGATGADINLATVGKLSNITKDLAANQQFTQIDWTFATTKKAQRCLPLGFLGCWESLTYLDGVQQPARFSWFNECKALSHCFEGFCLGFGERDCCRWGFWVANAMVL